MSLTAEFPTKSVPGIYGESLSADHQIIVVVHL